MTITFKFNLIKGSILISIFNVCTTWNSQKWEKYLSSSQDWNNKKEIDQLRKKDTSRIVLISNNISRQSHYLGFCYNHLLIFKTISSKKMTEKVYKNEKCFGKRNVIFGRFLSQPFLKRTKNKQNKNSILSISYTLLPYYYINITQIYHIIIEG